MRTKPGKRTTEFWVTAATVVLTSALTGLGAGGFLPEGFPLDQSELFLANGAVVVTYILQRGWLKRS